MPDSRVTSNKFIEIHQNGTSRRGPNPDAFMALPEEVVDGIGLYTHMGVRIDAALLSTFAYYGKKATNGGSVAGVKLGPGMFALSMLRAAENLWARWFHLPSDNEQFDRFYERVRKSAGRLQSAELIRWEAWLDQDSKRTKGSIWSFEESPLEPWLQHLYRVEARPVTVMRTATDEAGVTVHGMPLVNIVDLVGSAFVAEHPHMFTSAEACYSVNDRGLYLDYLEWTRSIARHGADGARFVSIGSVRPEDVGKDDPPTFLYWFTLDVDRDDPIDAVFDTKEILYTLSDMGANLQEVLVSYTGGKGCHVRIPCGMFDNPVFRSGSEARKVLGVLFESILGVEVDMRVLDPRQLIRIIGSRRAGTSFGDIHTQAIPGDRFLGMSMQDVIRASSEYVGMELPDPRASKPVPDLVVSLISASDVSRRASMPRFNRKNAWKDEPTEGSVVKAAMRGVTEGEEWHPSRNGRSYLGRNYAMFIAGCHILRGNGGDADAAWPALQEVNRNNTPPLPRSELSSCLQSARRRLERDRQVGRGR